MDVVSDFLKGELDEEIYMQQPPEYFKSGQEELVCKLRKSIYGLKQSPRCWNAKLSDHLKSLGCKERVMYNQWTRLLDWNTGMDYWTDTFLVFTHFWVV